jgi:transposase
VERYRAAAATGAAEAKRRPAALAAPGGTDRHFICAEERHSLGDAAPGDGVRVGDDVLAAAARLARCRRLEPIASRPARPLGRGACDRLEPGLRGQRICSGKKGGEKTGPNPTDRGRAGSKRHVITDANGVPLALRITAANVHDSSVFEELIDAVPPVRQGRGRPCQRPAKLHADKAYDLPRCRRALRQRRIGDRIARRGIESSERLGRHRWVIERTLAWFSRFRRLTIRYERRADIFQAFHHLAAALVCWRFLQRRFC